MVKHTPSSDDSSSINKGVGAAKYPIALAPKSSITTNLGFMITVVIGVITCTVYIIGIKSTSDRALEEIRSIRDDFRPVRDKTDRLWWEAQNRGWIGKIDSGDNHGKLP